MLWDWIISLFCYQYIGCDRQTVDLKYKKDKYKCIENTDYMSSKVFAVENFLLIIYHELH